MRAVWDWIVQAVTDLLGFLRDSNGKYSHKRLLALVFGVVAIRQIVIGDWAGAIVLVAGAIALGIVSAATGT